MPSFKKIDEAFKTALVQGVFPGAAIAAGTQKRLLLKEYYGLAEKIPVERKLKLKTYFDVASLTKPLCTAMLAMILCEKGEFDPDRPAFHYYSAWKKAPYSGILLRHLLQHTSGLPAWKPYFEEMLPRRIAGESSEVLRKEIIQRITKTVLEQDPGALRIYSDLGFVLLGDILEKITGKTLDRLFQDLIARPLKLNNTFFIRLNVKGKKIPRIEFASTGRCGIRRKIIAGEVDDEHAWIFDGVAGHAGLFSTLDDLIRYADEILKIEEGKSKLLSPKTFERFIYAKPPLGWDTPAAEDSQSGLFFSKDSIGHLGFTGCSLWINLTRKFYVLLLTNRVHPNRNNQAIKQFRPAIHDLVVKTLKLVK